MGFKDDLLRIGKEGFAIIDDEKKKGRISGPNYNKKPYVSSVQSRQPCLYQPQKAYFYKVKPPPTNETMFNTYEVVDDNYRGAFVMECNSKRKPNPMFY
ncbi:hypothetical protein CASFOL_030100 [Castilleja foliolosa]|uniref:Uncharacterized protein n=1 Tax=Castilleja foliolosa TaxID=1961234 RepID=A0ABD3CB40_9LAMI